MMAHDANVERIFSLMQLQWSKERGNLLASLVEKILIVLYNFADLSCRQVYDIVKDDTQLVKKVKSTEKYEWTKATSDEIKCNFFFVRSNEPLQKKIAVMKYPLFCLEVCGNPMEVFN